MARFALIQGVWVGLLTLMALRPVHAQQPGGQALDEGRASSGIKRSYLQASFNKIRAGSLLRGDGDKKPIVAGKLSEFEQRRDTELRTHYGRMAELDVMAEVATRGHNVGLAERIDLTRRREISRFLLAMQRLQVDILASNQDFGP